MAIYLGTTPYGTLNVGVAGQTINNEDKTVSPSESQQTITADEGYTGLGTVTVNAISSTYVGSGVDRWTSSDLTASGATVTAPAGYYENAATKSVSSGTAGTPTATKGTVSNHSISVTPSVTNTTGYITGGTKTGTAVSVSASELVSGSQTISQNGTVDVTNLASVVVSVSGGGVNIETKTVTASNRPSSLSFTSMKGEPKVFFVKATFTMTSSSTTYYYVDSMRYNGTNTTGRLFQMGSTRQTMNVTSGYSWSYSGTTLTVSSSGTRTTSPGCFYNGSYELVYVY